MCPRIRRILQALLYEAIAIAVVGPSLGIFFNEPMSSGIGMSVLMSTIALSWNFIFNDGLIAGKRARPSENGHLAGCDFTASVVKGPVAELSNLPVPSGVDGQNEPRYPEFPS
jgi:hypothetical protein